MLVCARADPAPVHHTPQHITSRNTKKHADTRFPEEEVEEQALSLIALFAIGNAQPGDEEH